MLAELSTKEIEEILTKEHVGRIGCHANGRTYVVPTAYAYVGGVILGCTAPGLKTHLLRVNSRCCFEVEQIADLSNWRSVIAQGNFQQIYGEEAEKAMAQLVESLRSKPGGGGTHHRRARPAASRGPPPSRMIPGMEESEVPAVVYRIVLREVTGRGETASPPTD